MDDTNDRYDDLLRLAARQLTGHRRRLFQAAVCRDLCGGNPRRAERRFGWGRANVRTGLHEAAAGIRCVERFAARGARRTEDANPALAADIRAVVEPHTQADPELRSDRRYSNLTSAEVLAALVATTGYAPADLPAARTMRDILNRLGYRLTRVRTGRPLKKTPETDAVFANVTAAKAAAAADPTTLELSMDAKAKVSIGDYVRGGKNPGRQ